MSESEEVLKLIEEKSARKYPSDKEKQEIWINGYMACMEDVYSPFPKETKTINNQNNNNGN